MKNNWIILLKMIITFLFTRLLPLIHFPVFWNTQIIVPDSTALDKPDGT